MDIGQIIIALCALIGSVTGVWGLLQQRKKNIAEAKKIQEEAKKIQEEAEKADAETAEIVQRIAKEQLKQFEDEINKLRKRVKELEPLLLRVDELESILIKKDNHISELKGMIAERDEKIQCLQSEVDELRGRLEKVEKRRNTQPRKD